jgi:hypothetical protein
MNRQVDINMQGSKVSISKLAADGYTDFINKFFVFDNFFRNSEGMLPESRLTDCVDSEFEPRM